MVEGPLRQSDPNLNHHVSFQLGIFSLVHFTSILSEALLLSSRKHSPRGHLSRDSAAAFERSSSLCPFSPLQQQRSVLLVPAQASAAQERAEMAEGVITWPCLTRLWERTAARSAHKRCAAVLRQHQSRSQKQKAAWVALSLADAQLTPLAAASELPGCARRASSQLPTSMRLDTSEIDMVSLSRVHLKCKPV